MSFSSLLLTLAVGCGPPLPQTAPYAPDTPNLHTWYLRGDGWRSTLQIIWDEAQARYREGLLTAAEDESGDATPPSPIDQISYAADQGLLRFRHPRAARWFQLRLVDGVLTGRVAEGQRAEEAPALAAFQEHVSGWSRETFDGELAPRVYDLLLNGEHRARLRFDQLQSQSPRRAEDAGSASPAFFGTFKIYATVSQRAAGEELEYPVQVRAWDGEHLQFALPSAAGSAVAGAVFEGTVRGRSLRGTFVGPAGPAPLPFTGQRAEVLSYGLLTKAAAARGQWQERNRLRLRHLMMAGAPLPTSTQVTVLAEHLPPLDPLWLPRDRDDAPDLWPQRYQRAELRLAHTLPGPDGAPLARAQHAYLLRPTTPPPPGGYPVALVVNGHDGSALSLNDPNDEYYWYGESFARRGFLVLALEIGHRPLEDRARLYNNYVQGDDPLYGNSPRPAIKAPGFDSDWEEDGERVWDVMRGVDYARALPDANPDQLLVTGLSLGGEVSTFAGALDPRLSLVVSAGFSPDLGVMAFHGNHPCWQWLHGDVREYLDVSDLHALIAPRTLLVQTGARDGIFSSFDPPYAGDLQVLRRSRAAYGEARDQLIHYLHYDYHHYHVGDENPTLGLPEGMPLIQQAFSRLRGTSWQTDPKITVNDASLFTTITAE